MSSTICPLAFTRAKEGLLRRKEALEFDNLPAAFHHERPGGTGGLLHERDHERESARERESESARVRESERQTEREREREVYLQSNRFIDD